MLLKPLFDRTVALVGLLLLWPVLLVIALLVRVKIGKPVIFVQERIGKEVKPFKIHKFHTMTDGLDDSPISIAGEERITRSVPNSANTSWMNCPSCGTCSSAT